MSAGDAPLSDDLLTEDFEEFEHSCIHESIEKNNLWLAKYRVHDWPRWDYSMDDATLTFSESGVAKVICRMQVVGSSQGDSWQWSWGNPNYPDACKDKMGAVRNLGEEKQWRRLTQLFLECDEYTGWACTSIASHILRGIGAYRCPSEFGFVYLVVVSSEFVN
jgi:hypothetical protein